MAFVCKVCGDRSVELSPIPFEYQCRYCGAPAGKNPMVAEVPIGQPAARTASGTLKDNASPFRNDKDARILALEAELREAKESIETLQAEYDKAMTPPPEPQRARVATDTCTGFKVPPIRVETQPWRRPYHDPMLLTPQRVLSRFSSILFLLAVGGLVGYFVVVVVLFIVGK